jgi:hypothetical protein
VVHAMPDVHRAYCFEIGANGKYRSEYCSLCRAATSCVRRTNHASPMHLRLSRLMSTCTSYCSLGEASPSRLGRARPERSAELGGAVRLSLSTCDRIADTSIAKKRTRQARGRETVARTMCPDAADASVRRTSRHT